MELGVFLALVLPGLGTGLGGLGLLWVREPSDRLRDAWLGITAGVMLAVTVFGLILPGLEEGPIIVVVAAGVGGAAMMLLLDRLLPHAHPRLAEGDSPPLEQRATHLQPRLLLAAMALHNLPEGLAVGAAFAGGGWELGLPIALAIGVQNVPEGFAAAAPLPSASTRPARAALIALGTGLVEPPAALFAYFALELAEPLLPVGLGFAAGAMAYVTLDELIPESRAHGNRRAATVALAPGFGLMWVLELIAF